MQPNILVYHATKADAYQQELQKYGIQAETASSPEEFLNLVPNAEIVLAWGLPEEAWNVASKLRWVQVTAAGIDHMVRVKHRIPDRVTVTRLLNVFGTPMSEYVFGHLLYIYKSMERMQGAQTQHLWQPFEPENLAGKVIGVAGLGSIGKEVVRKARAFDMTVYGLSRTTENAGSVDRHFTDTEWEAFAQDLDVMVVTLPRTAKTEHIVNEAVLNAMKQSAVFVNIGRGALVDEDALVQCLNRGHLRAAVLDVFEKEPLPESHPLWSLPNVFVSPHVSGVSTVPEVSQYFADNLKRYLACETMQGIVDFEKEY